MDKDSKKAFITERRFNERIQCEYSAIVRGSSVNGRKFEEYVTVLNLCAGGAYLLINRNIEVGQNLSVRIAIPTGSLDFGSSKLATTAVAMRTENYSEGVLGIGIKFQKFRFL